MGRKVILYVFTFALSIVIFAVLSLAIFSNTILNKQYVLDTLERNNYYEKTFADIQEGINNYGMQSGLEQEIFKDLYSREKVIQDVNQVISSIYDNKKIQISAEEIKEELENRIEKELEAHQKILEPKEKASIQNLEDAISETYVNGIVYSSEVVEKMGDPVQKIREIVQKLLMVSIALACALVLMIGMISKKEISRYLGISFMTSGILSMLLQFLVGDRVHYILLLNTAFSECVRSIINSIFQMFSMIGGILILLGLINCIIINRIKAKKTECKSE